MFYAFSYVPGNANTAAAPKKLPLPLSKGIIHQVDILFQTGCDHKVFVQIWDDTLQLWPLNRGEKLRGNATVISFRDFYEMGKGHSELTAYIWTTTVDNAAEVIIQIGVLPKEVLQPMSFDALLKAATGG